MDSTTKMATIRRMRSKRKIRSVRLPTGPSYNRLGASFSQHVDGQVRVRHLCGEEMAPGCSIRRYPAVPDPARLTCLLKAVQLTSSPPSPGHITRNHLLRSCLKTGFSLLILLTVLPLGSLTSGLADYLIWLLNSGLADYSI
ncbi:uncharacterized protein LOC143939995 [Lithobates pipiens]